MFNKVSVFENINVATPKTHCDWHVVIERIRNGSFKERIEKLRSLLNESGKAEYNKYKGTIPAATFSASFTKRRRIEFAEEPTGFLVADIDNIDDVDLIFNILQNDENIWFMFRSPSCKGIKCAFRSDKIENDIDFKEFFYSSENYFKTIYGITIDPLCKDISRLTIISHDPDLYLPENASLFPIDKWKKESAVIQDQRFYIPNVTDNGWKGRYGLKVLESSCKKIREAYDGNKHATRLHQSRLVGGFVASGFIEESIAIGALEQAARDSGTSDPYRALRTVNDGLKYGKCFPINPEQRGYNEYKPDDIQYYFDIDEAMNGADKHDKHDKHDNARQCTTNTTEHDNARQEHDRNTTNTTENGVDDGQKKVFNLAAEIKKWVENSAGSFTTDQLDRDFCLTTRREKQNRDRVLRTLLEKKIVNKDKRVRGKYIIVDTNLKTIDIFNTDEEPFPINLPFNLHRFVSIPKHSIIIIAGSSNAGKTALIMNILKMNLNQEYCKLYLMSEMGAGEYVDRIRRFDDVDFKEWQKVTAAERTCGFNDAIEHYCKDGLTCVDFLEEVDGEYYKIPTDIRNIYDALGDGVALIAIQKKTDSDYGRGGQATTEKPRLYMSVDLVTVQEHCIICALKIIKLKRFIKRNLQGHEIHFRIFGGSKIEPVTEWMRSEPGLREKMKAQYDLPDGSRAKPEEYAFTFKTVSGKYVGINQERFEMWEETYSNINLWDALEKISNDTYRKSWLKDKSWIFQITSSLSKKNDEAALRDNN